MEWGDGRKGPQNPIYSCPPKELFGVTGLLSHFIDGETED